MSRAFDASEAVWLSEGLEDYLVRCRAMRDSAFLFVESRVCDRVAVFASDDPYVLDHLFLFFGGSAVSSRRPAVRADLAATIITRTGAPYGLLTLDSIDGLPDDGREFEFAVAENGLFTRSTIAGWTAISTRSDERPLFLMRGREHLFRLDGEWQKVVSIFLFCRYLRLHSDYIFFHASSVTIGDRGIMFIGDKGAGKSTTSLALASRGHGFLGDEIAAYAPSTGMLMPFRRPVGIKPGPRAAAVETGLRTAERVVAAPGFVRVDIDDLMTIGPAAAQRLDAIVFLRPFEAKPRLVPIRSCRDDMARLQPIVSGFLSASYRQRVFELVRMLAGVRTYELHPGQPDETAAFLEEAFSS